MAFEMVHTQTGDGVRLDGSMRTSESGGSQLDVDCAIFHHGVGGSFYGTRFYDVLEASLVAQGCSVIRTNNRGHDLIYNSPKGRLGAAYENVDDCRLDWQAWLDFAKQQGYQRILLGGHSLGAVKTIYFLANGGDPAVKYAAAFSPPRFSYQHYAGKQGGDGFAAFFANAKKLVDDGKPQTLIDVEIPTHVVLTAATYVDKYGPADRYDIVKHLPNVQVPILVTIGTVEDNGLASPEYFAFAGLTERLQELAKDTPRLTVASVEGANHVYTDKAEALWDTTLGWMQQATVSAPR